MGRTKIAVTKALIEEALHFPVGMHIVSITSTPDTFITGCLDVEIEGIEVPDAERCEAIVHKERMRYEFKPLSKEEIAR